MREIKGKLYFALAGVLIAAGSFLTGFRPVSELWSQVSVQTQNKQNEIIINKGFYFLETLDSIDSLKSILNSNDVLSRVSRQKFAEVRKALDTCRNVSCYSTALKWSEPEIKLIGDELVKLYQTNASFKPVATLLRKGGKYKLFEKDDLTLLRKAWDQDARGLNNLLSVYIEGKKPLYPKIDAISFQSGDQTFQNALRDSLKSLLKQPENNPLFFKLTLYAGLNALAINDRDEAARYEPLHKGINQSAYGQIERTNWGKYKYSAILVPGQGPDSNGVVLDPIGANRCKLAAERYNRGLAPFIIVSGGNVHPNKTPYNEAVEMKNYMVKDLNIPENAIFIEPHARHTTTNIRNANRMIFQFGFPVDKPVVTVTDPKQSKYILTLDKRCISELGYLPYRKMRKINDIENEYYPESNSSHSNPFDILDP